MIIRPQLSQVNKLSRSQPATSAVTPVATQTGSVYPESAKDGFTPQEAQSSLAPSVKTIGGQELQKNFGAYTNLVQAEIIPELIGERLNHIEEGYLKLGSGEDASKQELFLGELGSSTSNNIGRVRRQAESYITLNPEAGSQSASDYDFKAAQKAKDQFTLTLNRVLDKAGLNAQEVSMSLRAKTPSSVEGKMTKRLSQDDSFTLSHLTDTVGARIDVEKLEDVVQVSQALEKQLGAKIVGKDNYFTNPGDNGYRALHYIVDLGDRMAELQVTTHNQRAADQVTHDTLYKPLKPLPESTDKKQLETVADRGFALDLDSFDSGKLKPSRSSGFSSAPLMMTMDDSFL